MITPKSRLEKTAEEAVQAYKAWLDSRVESLDPVLVRERQQAFDATQARFVNLWRMRGFMPGDHIRVTAEGPYRGQEGVIRGHARFGGSVSVRWPAGSPLAEGSGVLRSLDHVTLVRPVEESPSFVRVREAKGRQLACMVSDACSYKTSVWHVDDGSAEEQIYRHLSHRHASESAVSA